MEYVIEWLQDPTKTAASPSGNAQAPAQPLGDQVKQPGVLLSNTDAATAEPAASDIPVATQYPTATLLYSSSEDGELRVTDFKTGLVLRRDMIDGSINKISVNPNQAGEVAIATTEDSNIIILTSKGITGISGHTKSLWDVKFSNMGDLLASSSDDYTIRVYSASQKRFLVSLPLYCVPHCIAFSPDDKMIASGGADGVGRIWNLSTAKLATILRGHFGPIVSIAYSPDQKHIATGGTDQMCRLFHADSGYVINALSPNDGSINAVLFGHASNLLVAATANVCKLTLMIICDFSDAMIFRTQSECGRQRRQ